MEGPLAAVALAAGFAGGARAADAVPPAAPAALVAQLGAADSAQRAEAEKQLRAWGSAARADVRRAVLSPDPAVRAGAARLWETLRWQVFPGLDTDEADGLRASFGDPDTQRRWTEAIAGHGADMVLVMAEMMNCEGEAANAGRALALLLNTVPPREVAEVVARESAGGVPGPVRLLLQSAAGMDLDRAAQVRLAEAQAFLWLYADAFETARQGWMRWKEDALLEVCRLAIRRGDLGDRVWAGVTGKSRYGDVATRCRERLFYVRLAQRLGEPQRLRGRIRLDDPEVCPAADLEELVDGLVALNLGGDAAALLTTAESPRTVYLRSVARAAAGQAEAAKADREAALQTALAPAREGAEANLFELGEIMDRHGDRGAEALWKRILEISPSNSMYDANSMLRLAKYAEARGELANAADLYERALKLTREPGASIAFSSAFGAASPQDGAEWLRRHIRELKRKVPAGSTAAP